MQSRARKKSGGGTTEPQLRVVDITRLAVEANGPGWATIALRVLAAFILFMGWVELTGSHPLAGVALLGTAAASALASALLPRGLSGPAFWILGAVSVAHVPLLWGGEPKLDELGFLGIVWVITAVAAAQWSPILSAPASAEAERLQLLVRQRLDTPANRAAKSNWARARQTKGVTSAQVGWKVLQIGTLVVGTLLMPLSPSAPWGALGAVRRKAKERALQHGAAGADEMLGNDPRNPVLYLRSFSNESIRTGLAPWAEGYLEEIAVEAFSLVGPIVAIGVPGARLPPANGAARDYVGDDWKDVIRDYMDRAQVTVAVVGTSRGLIWELEELSKTGHMNRAVFIVPPLYPFDIESRWRPFAQYAASKLGLPAMRLVVPTQTLVLFMDGVDHLVAITAANRNATTYQLAIRMAAASKV